MAHRFAISIAGILIEVESPLSPRELGIERRMSAFLQRTNNPLAYVFLRWEKAEEELRAEGELIFDPGSIFRMFKKGNKFYCLLDYGNGTSQALLISDEKWNDLLLRERFLGDNWTSLLSIGAGELIVRAKLPQTGGLLFHSSGINYKGKGVMFVGHSGEGKSTMIAQWEKEEEAIPMNDDRMAVRVLNEGVLCYGTPWGGTAEIANNYSAPLEAIFLLEKAEKNEIVSLSPSQSAPLLMARACLPWWDERLLQLSLDTLDKIIQSTPVYLLRWKPGKEAIELIKSLL